MSGADAVRALANAVFNQAIAAVVEWGFAQVKALVMGQTAQAAATTAGIAQGAALQAAYAPAAIAASIASFGAAPVAATSSMAANVPAMAAMLTAARKNGGTVAAGGLYRVNEGGAPEIFTGGNGQQYLMPNKRGQVVSNVDATGGGGGAVTVNVYNQAAKAQVRTETREDETGKFVSVFVEDMDSGGPMFQALQGVSNVTRVGQ
jgi:SLT domain-containing protein